MKRLLLTAAIVIAAAASGFSQGVKDMVINELLVKNAENYEDDYGHRVSWVELFNNGYSQVDLASCFLQISDGNETVRYRIPKNDSRTMLAPQGYTVFFCEGTGSKGTFHTNFTLSMGDTTNADKNITLTLFEANGKDTVSSVTYNLADQKNDISIGRLKADDQILFTALDATTPLATNDTAETLPPHENFRRTDPIGYGMALTAMSVVFVALLLLYLVFRTVGKFNVMLARRRHFNQLLSQRKMHLAHHARNVSEVQKNKEVLSGEIAAAIGLALNMFEDEMHDHESTVLTINRISKVYSPWSSKLYGLTEMPQRKGR